MDNPFRAKTPEEIKLNEDRERECNKYFNEMIRVGKNLLSDERYGEFKRLFEEFEKIGVEYILNYEEDDAGKFQSRIMRMQERVKTLKKIIDEAPSIVNDGETYKRNSGFKHVWSRMFKGVINAGKD